MTVFRVLDLAMVLTAASLLARALWTPWSSDRLAQIVVVAAPLAFVIGGVTYLFWLLAGAPTEWVLWSIDFAVVLLAWFISRRLPPTVAPEPGVHPEPRIRFFIYAATAAVLVAAVAILLGALRGAPHGDWDAFAIWNLRARFLYRNPAEWTWAIDQGIAHRGYPLLQPLIVARGWQFAGTDTTLAPRALAFASLFLTVALLFLTVRRLRGAVAACLAVLALLSLRSYAYPMLRMVSGATTQYAESLLVCFMIAAVCAMVLAVAAGERPARTVVLAGVFAGCAAWTKNEGQLFALCLLVALSIVTYRTSGLHAALRSARAYLVGLAPLAVLLWIVKGVYVRAASSEFFSRGLGGTLGDIADVERHRLILQGAVAFVSHRAHLPLLFLLTVLALSAGLSRRRECRTAAATVAVTLALMTAGYYTIYLISPFPLDWLIAWSMDRLFMQVWPVFILLFFVAIRTPAEFTADMATDGAVRGSTSERRQLGG